MKRKTKWVLGLSMGGPILLIAAALIVLRLSSNPSLDLTSIEVKDLPGAWAQESVDADNSSADEPDIVEPSSEDSSDVGVSQNTGGELPTIESFNLPISGTLVMANDDKPFGEESFELGWDGENVMLRSNGQFWFKALIATITLGPVNTIVALRR